MQQRFKNKASTMKKKKNYHQRNLKIIGFRYFYKKEYCLKKKTNFVA